jgi:hypothetical protein
MEEVVLFLNRLLVAPACFIECHLTPISTVSQSCNLVASLAGRLSGRRTDFMDLRASLPQDKSYVETIRESTRFELFYLSKGA